MGTDIIIPISRSNRSSFRYSFSFLPKEKRKALHTIYAFCRTTDDIVDNDDDDSKKFLNINKWRVELSKAFDGTSSYQLLNQLVEIANKFNIPTQHFYELIKGVEMDLFNKRYETFQELKDYCYHVASSVGLISIKIFGICNERVVKYAENLGIALQLTNILRDIKTDAKYTRIYIPKEDILKFNYSEEELLTFRYNANFIRLMEFESNRAENYFQIAQSALLPGDKKFLYVPKIMERIYFHTLKRIKANNYDVFSKSLRLPKYLQLLIAMKYFVKYRIFQSV